MKKQVYIQPMCDMTQLELQTVIADSIPTPDQLGNSGGNELGDPTDASRRDFNSRRRSVWDDDQELEEEQF